MLLGLGLINKGDPGVMSRTESGHGTALPM